MRPEEVVPARRPLKTRQRRWAHTLAAKLAAAGATPNQISIGSVVFALMGCGCLITTRGSEGLLRAILLIATAGAIQLRLLCNLIDGLVAVECGKKTATGEIFNDAPDRVADVAFLAGAGYSIGWLSWGADLGWAASAIALSTAYVRYLGAGMGTQQFFLGPMAKPHRMATLTLACLVGAGEALGGSPGYAIPTALVVIVLGGIVTIVRRLRAIARAVESH